jgi:hypothetical protein
MRLGWRKREWSRVDLPQDRGSAAVEVLQAPPGPERDKAIDEWCRSVWSACSPACRNTVVELLRECQIV